MVSWSDAKQYTGRNAFVLLPHDSMLSGIQAPEQAS
jgi:hypothetical protein